MSNRLVARFIFTEIITNQSFEMGICISLSGLAWQTLLFALFIQSPPLKSLQSYE